MPDRAGRQTCGDPRIVTKAVFMMTTVIVKMLFGKLPKTW